MSTTGRTRRPPPDRDEAVVPLTQRRQRAAAAATARVSAEENNSADVPLSTLDTAADNVEHGFDGSVTNASSNPSADQGPATGRSQELLAESRLKTL